MKYLLLLLMLITSMTYANDSHVDVNEQGSSPTLVNLSSAATIDDAINALIEQASKTPPVSYDHQSMPYFTNYDVDRDWGYVEVEDDFYDVTTQMARLISNDGHAILFVMYQTSDKKYQNPMVGINLSGGIDDGEWHNFVCIPKCPNIDVNVDGKKYPNIPMNYGWSKTLVAKQPNTLLGYLKSGKTIKIRVASASGNSLIYVFEPTSPFDLKNLKSL